MNKCKLCNTEIAGDKVGVAKCGHCFHKQCTFTDEEPSQADQCAKCIKSIQNDYIYYTDVTRINIFEEICNKIDTILDSNNLQNNTFEKEKLIENSVFNFHQPKITANKNLIHACPECCVTLFNDEKEELIATREGIVMHLNCYEMIMLRNENIGNYDNQKEEFDKHSGYTKLRFSSLEEITRMQQDKLNDNKYLREDLMDYIAKMEKVFEKKELEFGIYKSEMISALGLKKAIFNRYEGSEYLRSYFDFSASQFYKTGNYTVLPQGAKYKDFLLKDNVIIEVGKKLKEKGVEKLQPPSCIDFLIPMSPSFELMDKRQYQGQICDGICSGWGRLKSSDNTAIWEGFFNNGTLNGYGLYIDNDACFYLGNFNNGKRVGYGIYYDSDGETSEIHEGEKDFSYSHGYNNCYVENREGNIKLIYKGFMEKGCYQGYGATFDEIDGLYEGNWVDNAKNGLGKLILPLGNIYYGFFEDDRKQGYGEIHYIDGSQFKGFFYDNMKNGYGEFIEKFGEKGLHTKLIKAIYQDDIELIIL